MSNNNFSIWQPKYHPYRLSCSCLRIWWKNVMITYQPGVTKFLHLFSNIQFLFLLIQCIVDTGIWPDEWKAAFINPLHKHGSISLAQNYDVVRDLNCSFISIVYIAFLMRVYPFAQYILFSKKYLTLYLTINYWSIIQLLVLKKNFCYLNLIFPIECGAWNWIKVFLGWRM